MIRPILHSVNAAFYNRQTAKGITDLQTLFHTYAIQLAPICVSPLRTPESEGKAKGEDLHSSGFI